MKLTNDATIKNVKDENIFESNNNRNVKFLSLVMSIFFSFVLVYFICLFIKHNFYYLDKLDIDYILRVFAVPMTEFVPEKVEKIQFLSSIIIFPILVFLFNLILLKHVKFPHLSETKINLINISIIFSLLLLFFIDFTSNDYFYLINNYYFGRPLQALILMSLIIIALYFESTKKIYNSKLYVGCLNIISILVIITILLISIFSIYSIQDNLDFSVHVSAYLYSIVQVYMGKALFVNLVNQYGLYPHILEPIFRVIGLSFFKLTLVLGLLLSSSFFLIYLFLRDIIKTRIISVIGFMSVAWTNLFFTKIMYPIPYFQNWPNRVLFPFILIYLTWVYFKGKNKKLIYYLSFVLYSVAILWNTDTGIPVYISWLLVLSYSELYGNIKIGMKNILMHVIKGVLIFVSILFCYSLYIRFRYGDFPNFNMGMDYIRLFYDYGYYMIKMEIDRPWNLVILTYMIGIAISAQSLIIKSDTIKTRMIFLISILGVGIFPYYQGRSHDLNLLAICYPCIILVTIFTDDIFQIIRSKICQGHENNISKFKLLGTNIPMIIAFMLLILFLSSSFFSIIYNFKSYYAYIENNIKAAVIKQPTKITEASEFIKKYTKPNEEILILSLGSEIYYMDSNTICPLDIPGPAELCLKSDFEKIEKYICNSNAKQIFVNKNFFSISVDKGCKENIQKALNKYYRIDEISKQNVMHRYVRNP